MKTMTVNDAEKKFGISESTVYRWIRSGKLKAEKVEGEWKIEVPDDKKKPAAKSKPAKKRPAPKSSVNPKPETKAADQTPPQSQKPSAPSSRPASEAKDTGLPEDYRDGTPFGAYLRAKRTLAGLTHDDLAERASIFDDVLIEAFERGSAFPNPLQTAGLAQVLGIDPTRLQNLVDHVWR